MVNVKGRGSSRVNGHSRVAEAPSRSRRQPPIASGYQLFRLERQGALLADKTLLCYDGMVLPFLDWLDGQEVRRFEDLDVGLVRAYRARLAARLSQHGRPLQPKTILESHRAILCFPHRTCRYWSRRTPTPWTCPGSPSMRAASWASPAGA